VGLLKDELLYVNDGRERIAHLYLSLSIYHSFSFKITSSRGVKLKQIRKINTALIITEIYEYPFFLNDLIKD